MIKSMTVDDLRARAATIGEWLGSERNSQLQDHLHLDRSTAECAYWHLGYQQALSDIVQMITSSAHLTSISDTPN